MRVLIQRVTNAEVFVLDEESLQTESVGKIQKGYVILLGVGQEDTREDVERLVKKTLALRIFEDEDGKTNRSLMDVGGELMIISQFTLYADCHKGNRPNFLNAAKPQIANELYEYFIELCKERVEHVAHGRFGAHMQVSLVNDGPFTIMLE